MYRIQLAQTIRQAMIGSLFENKAKRCSEARVIRLMADHSLIRRPSTSTATCVELTLVTFLDCRSLVGAMHMQLDAHTHAACLTSRLLLHSACAYLVIERTFGGTSDTCTFSPFHHSLYPCLLLPTPAISDKPNTCSPKQVRHNPTCFLYRSTRDLLMRPA